MLVERVHTVALAGLDHRVHLRDFRLANQVANGRGANHQLISAHTTVAGLVLEQCLRNHRAQRLRQHRAHHVLLGGRKDVDHAIDGLRGRARVQRAENEVARFRCSQRQPDRFEIAHLADQDDVRIFTQRCAQRVGERKRVRADFTLVDQALFRIVDELDRVFDGQDVTVQIGVDVIDHRGECGRLAGARRPGYQHEAARRLADVLKITRKSEVLERQHLGGNRPEHDACAAILNEAIHAKACEVRDREREVDLERFFVRLALRIGHDVVHHPMHVLVLERREVDATDIAVDAYHRRHSGGQVQVGRLVLDRKR